MTSSANDTSTPRSGAAGFAVRAVVSLALLAWALATVDFQSLRKALDTEVLLGTLGGALLILASLVPAAERWRVIAKAVGSEITFRTALQATLYSTFALQVTPSTIGADIVRVAAVRTKGVKLTDATASVLVDRLYGVASLVLLGVASLPILMIAAPEFLLPATLLVLVFVAAFVGLWLVRDLRAPRAWLRRKPVRAVARVIRAIHRGGSNLSIAPHAIAASLASHALVFAAFWLVLRAAGAHEAGAGTVLGAFPTANLIALIPVSISGWGVREASLVPLLGGFDVPAATALAASVAYGGGVFIAGLAALALAGWVEPRKIESSPRPPRSIRDVLASTPALFACCFALAAVFVAAMPSSLNQAGWLDPYLYSALIYNYEDLVGRYGVLYYMTRVAYVMPAKFFVDTFGLHAGYEFYRVVILASVTFPTLLIVRRWWGLAAGLTMAGVVGLGPWIVRAALWDYVDGAAIGYMLCGLACLIVPRRNHLLWSVLAGAFFVGAVNSNLMALPFAGAFGPAYLYLQRRNVTNAALRILAMSAGFVATYAIISFTMYRAYPEVGPFFEARTITMGGSLLGGAAKVWHYPLSEVVRAGMLYSFLPFIVLGLLGATLVARPAAHAALTNDDRDVRYAALIYLAIVCVGLILLHFVFQVGTMIWPWGIIWVFPSVMLGWAALLGPHLRSSNPARAVALGGSLVAVLAGAWFTGPVWMVMQVDSFELPLATAAAALLGLAFLQKTRSVALVGLVALMAVLPFLMKETSNGKTTYFSHPIIEQSEALEFDIVEGGRHLTDRISALTPRASGEIGFWYAEPLNRYLVSLSSFYMAGYSNVGVAGVGMPNLNEDVKANILKRRYLALIGLDAAEINVALEALRGQIKFNVLEDSVWRGDEWSYGYAIIEVLPDWRAELGASPTPIAEIPPGLVRLNAGAELVVTSDRHTLTTDPRFAAWSGRIAIPSDLQGATGLRVRARVSKGVFQLVIVPNPDLGGPYEQAFIRAADRPGEAYIALPTTAKPPFDLVIANGSTQGATIGSIDAIEVLGPPSKPHRAP